MADYSEQRELMVERQLIPNEIVHPILLVAAKTIPREKFLPDHLAGLSYIDDFILLDQKHYFLRLADLMRMIQALNLESTDKVLDIGCATGYSSIVLSYLVNEVIGLEDMEELVSQANNIIEELKTINVTFMLGSYSLGCLDKAPYDAILVQHPCFKVPDELLDQLAENGRLVYIQQEQEHYGRAYLLEKINNTFSEKILFEVCSPYFNQKQEFLF